MKRQMKWIGLLLCGVIVVLAGYCWHRATSANLHYLLAEQEDLKLFPELGREINVYLGVMMLAVIVLGGSTAFLLSRSGTKPEKR